MNMLISETTTMMMMPKIMMMSETPQMSKTSNVRDYDDDDVWEMTIDLDLDISNGKKGAWDEKAFENKEWRDAMNSEMEIIEKNAT